MDKIISRCYVPADHRDNHAVFTCDPALLERAAGGGLIAFVGCQLRRLFSRFAAGLATRVKLGALLEVAATMTNWTALWRAFESAAAPRCCGAMVTRPARSRFSLWSGRVAVLRQRVAGGVVKVLDLARVKINEPKPWMTPTPLLSWSHSSDVRRESVLLLRRLASAVCRV